MRDCGAAKGIIFVAYRPSYAEQLGGRPQLIYVYANFEMR